MLRVDRLRGRLLDPEHLCDCRPDDPGLRNRREVDEERLAELYSVHSDGISKAFPAGYELYGVRKGDRIKPRTVTVPGSANCRRSSGDSRRT